MDNRIKYNRANVAEINKLATDYPDVLCTSTDKSTLLTDVQIIIQDAIDVLSPDYTTALAELAAMKTAVSSAITDGIDTIEVYNEGIISDITDAEVCVQCGGQGKILPSADITLDEADRALTDEIICPLCNGDTRTEGAYRAVYSNPIGYELIP